MTARLHEIGSEEINATISMNTAKLKPPRNESTIFFLVRKTYPFFMSNVCTLPL